MYLALREIGGSCLGTFPPAPYRIMSEVPLRAWSTAWLIALSHLVWNRKWFITEFSQHLSLHWLSPLQQAHSCPWHCSAQCCALQHCYPQALCTASLHTQLQKDFILGKYSGNPSLSLVSQVGEKASFASLKSCQICRYAHLLLWCWRNKNKVFFWCCNLQPVPTWEGKVF